jgi:FkbM family methyltransferase
MLPAQLSNNPAQKSWSQFGEDEILCSELSGLLQTGYYLDIGANHPAKLSNTFRLYSMGMRGITVEPDQTLSRLHGKFRPGDVQLCAASGDHDGLSKFFRLSYHALSTFSWDDAQNTMSKGIQLLSQSLVPIFTVETILDNCHLAGRQEFALLSVDVESLDEIVLRSNDWLKYRPRIVIFENSDHNDNTAREFLAGFGYELIATRGCNEIMKLRVR